MGFRLVPNSVTLNDLKRRKRSNGCVNSPNSVAYWADCVKVVEDIYGYFLRQKCGPDNVVFNHILFMAILAGITPSDSDKVMHSLSLAKI